jgi:peptidoglycan-N-acetylglucosamine deacetylase
VPVTLLALMAALAVLVIAAWPSGPHASPAAHASLAAGAGTPTPPAPDRPRHLAQAHPALVAAAALTRRENRAINTVLRYTPFVARGTGRRRDVALTFDDGPGPYTPSVLRVLESMHAPATFFIVGQQVPTFGGAVRSEVRHGFPVEDHTENHAWLIRLGAAGQYSQIQDAAARLAHLGVAYPRMLRPPYGAFNATTVRTLARMRMLMVLWSVDPQDWRRPGVGAIVSNVLRNASPGSIVLLHDGGGYRDQTVKALPAIIDGLRRRHYRLVTVPQLVIDDPPPRHQSLARLGSG